MKQKKEAEVNNRYLKNRIQYHDCEINEQQRPFFLREIMIKASNSPNPKEIKNQEKIEAILLLKNTAKSCQSI